MHIFSAEALRCFCREQRIIYSVHEHYRLIIFYHKIQKSQRIFVLSAQFCYISIKSTAEICAFLSLAKISVQSSGGGVSISVGISSFSVLPSVISAAEVSVSAAETVGSSSVTGGIVTTGVVGAVTSAGGSV